MYTVSDNPKFRARLARGESGAYEFLFGLFYSTVKRSILVFVHDEDLAGDLAQNVFMKVWIQRKNLQAVESLPSYIKSMARNEVYDYFRREKVKQRYVDGSESVGDGSHHISIDYDENVLREGVALCLDQMPKQRREIYQMSRERYLSNSDIAKSLNISVKSVEYHITNALGQIREVLTKIK